MKTTFTLFFLIALYFGMAISQSQPSLIDQKHQIEYNDNLQSTNDAPLEGILTITFIISGILGYRDFKRS